MEDISNRNIIKIRISEIRLFQYFQFFFVYLVSIIS